MKKTIYTYMISCCFIIIAILTANGQAGSLDLTFGSEGIVTTAIGSYEDRAHSVVIQSDGKILVAGESDNGFNTDFALARYNSDGTLDNTFSSDGKVTTTIGSNEDKGLSVAIQANGKIVVAGYSYNDSTLYDFAVFRYNHNGTPDNTFSYDGKVTTDFESNDDYAYSVAIQSDGKIVVAGSSNNGSDADFAVVRYNDNGTLDDTFGSGGKVTTAIGINFDVGFSVAIQIDGKIVVAGYNYGFDIYFALIRYNSNGSLDSAFDSDGIVTTAIGSERDMGYSVAIQSDGKIVVAGTSEAGLGNDFALVRYNSDGSLDTTFDSDGKVRTDFGGSSDIGASVAIHSDGKIVVAGYRWNSLNTDFALVQYHSDGSLDKNFGSDGKVITPIGISNDDAASVSIQSDGKIVVVGSSRSDSFNDFTLARYEVGTVGIDENREEENIFTISPNPFTNEVVIKGTKESDVIVIFDVIGIEIMRLKSSEAETNINTESFLPGFYFLNYREDNKMMSSKLVKL